MAWWGWAAGVNGAAAPLVAASFGVSESALAASLGWIGVASLGALGFGRVADRIGRRRVALAAAGVLPWAAAATALAPSLAAYVAAQMVVYACGTTLLAALIVLASERAEPARRAKAQADAGLAFLAGTALPLLACAWIAPHGALDAERWRWLWWAAAAPAGLWPWARRRLSDAPAVRRSTVERDAAPALLRGRVPVLLAAASLIAAAEVAARSWLFFHVVASLGLSPRRAIAVIAAGGAASLVGFSSGARLADRAGRRLAFLAAAVLFAIGATGYFGVSLDVTGDPTAVLLLSFVAMGVGGNAATTVFRAHATELAPARSRGALAGALAVANAAGWVVAMFATSVLASVLGSLGFAVTALVSVAVPIAIALVLCLPETMGEQPAGETTGLREIDLAA
jgi:MFS family permease